MKHLPPNTSIKSYEAILADLKDAGTHPKKYLLGASCNAALRNALGADSVVEAKHSPVLMPKALKNEVEIENMRIAHLKDAAALCDLFAWAEESLAKGQSLDEMDISDELLRCREKQADFKGASFPTIAGSGPNGAIIHYRPERGSCAKVTTTELFLLDSGGQYL